MPAYTREDLAAINEAIAAGAKRVRFADGRETEFRSLADLRSIRDEILVDQGLVEPQPRVTYASFTRD